VSRSFVVREGDATTVAGVLARLGETDLAVAEGRVFLGRRRVESPTAPVQVGDEVVVQAPQDAVHEVTVLSEWEGVYAVSKPAGVPTEPDRRGGASVVRLVAPLIGAPASVLHAATRLDAQVSGVVLIARGGEAHRRVAALKEAGELHRRYVALASHAVVPPVGVWDAPIGAGPRGRRVAFGRDAEVARTRYRFRGCAPPDPELALAAFAVLEPVTGRTHQLRVHAATAGAPLLGDVTYGGPRRLVQPDGQVIALDRVALHAASVSVVVAGKVEWSVRAPHPADLVRLWVRLGGPAAVFDEALVPGDPAAP
jgi:23S rRNA pseudouridine1911/1915/1917 synthase